jgi:hypothetical protein
MVTRLPCPYLQGEVELSAERIVHINNQHPELPGNDPDMIARTLLDPDEVRTDRRFPRTQLFSRWLDDLLHGKILVVAVVTDDVVADDPDPTVEGQLRHWVVTAYPTRRVTQGDIQWQRP